MRRQMVTVLRQLHKTSLDEIKSQLFPILMNIVTELSTGSSNPVLLLGFMSFF